MKHMLLATLKGRFDAFDGVLEIGADGARAAGTVKAGSIDTDEPVRNEHLRSSPDFFDVERHPEISFTSTRISSREGGHLQIAGALTMRGITREISLDGRLSGSTLEMRDATRIQLALSGELNRKDFGLTWNQALDTGGALLGNKVKIALDISAVRATA
jgi:polyisoprenoid-binding protein YceI